jgi:hypothetical protein
MIKIGSGAGGLGSNTYAGDMTTDAALVVVLPNPGVLIIRYPRSQVE